MDKWVIIVVATILAFLGVRALMQQTGSVNKIDHALEIAKLQSERDGALEKARAAKEELAKVRADLRQVTAERDRAEQRLAALEKKTIPQPAGK